ncbi:MAG: hypothetical protein JWO41_66 [Candidatus Saccharibacteria bacterium]|nr:hypothetical protein [Candidatus Saccharibacteria bacterium]
MSEIREKLTLMGPQLDEATRQKIGWLLESSTKASGATKVRQRQKQGRPRGDTPGLREYPPEYMIKKEARDLPPIEPPVNEFGLIDIDDLVRQVKSRVRRSHRWSRSIMVAHFYHPEEEYLSHSDPVARTFRDLPVHKAVVPRDFENFFHDNTLQPQMPNVEVMHEVVSAWKVTKDAFLVAKELAWWEKRDENHSLMRWFRDMDVTATVEHKTFALSPVVAGIQDRLRDGLQLNLANLEAVPPEFRVTEVPPAGMTPVEVATMLGRVVAPSAMTLTEKIAA